MIFGSQPEAVPRSGFEVGFLLGVVSRGTGCPFNPSQS